MRLNLNWNRRGFLGSTTAALASLFAPLKLSSFAANPGAGTPQINGFGQSGNPYDELGVKPTVTDGGLENHYRRLIAD